MIKRIITAFLIGLGFFSFLTNQNSVLASENEEITNEELETELIESLDPETLEAYNHLDNYLITDINGVTIFDSNTAISNNESDLLVELGNTFNEFGEEFEETDRVSVRSLWGSIKFTVYGNYCGSAGKSGNDWSKKAIDNLDAQCRKHDLCYSHKNGANNKTCNKAFMRNLLPVIQTSNKLSKKHAVAVIAYKYFSKKV